MKEATPEREIEMKKRLDEWERTGVKPPSVDEQWSDFQQQHKFPWYTRGEGLGRDPHAPPPPAAQMKADVERSDFFRGLPVPAQTVMRKAMDMGAPPEMIATAVTAKNGLLMGPGAIYKAKRR